MVKQKPDFVKKADFAEFGPNPAQHKRRKLRVYMS